MLAAPDLAVCLKNLKNKLQTLQNKPVRLSLGLPARIVNGDFPSNLKDYFIGLFYQREHYGCTS